MAVANSNHHVSVSGHARQPVRIRMHLVSYQQNEPEEAKSVGTYQFERVLHQCRPELLAYLRSRVRDPADAEDLTQEAFTRVLHYRDNPEIVDMRTMLFRIANNVLTDHYRRSDRRCANDHVHIDTIAPIQAPELTHVERIANSEALVQLRRVIERLPPKCQLAFMLSRFDGLSHKQIAARMGISPKMVEKHITRALQACLSIVGNRDA